MDREHYSGHGVGHEAPRRLLFTRREYIKTRHWVHGADDAKGNVTDYGSSMVQWLRHRRMRCDGGVRMEEERPSGSYVVDMLPSCARGNNAFNVIPAKMLHSSLNKIKHPVNVVKWTPEGRRLLTGSSSGEFTLWNGMAFNFETILQAHDTAIRAIVYSHNEDWIISADQDGVVKYWQTNFNNVKVLQAHGDSIRDMAFAPNDGKFVTACDDHTLNIFDFAAGVRESSLTGHNWDVKSVDWHPTKGLLVSGSKDHHVKLWDPRTGQCLTTLHGHKNTISRTKFEPKRGDLLATCARDQTARIFDLRMMRDICLLRGHEKDVSSLTWHPHHTNLLSTGGADGSLFHYLLNEPNTPAGSATSPAPYDTSEASTTAAQTIFPAHRIPFAHDFTIWSLDWHPLGHILASGSNDRVTRFWTRARPGDSNCFNDRFHLGEEEAVNRGTWDKRDRKRTMHEDEIQEMEDEAGGLEDQKMPVRPSGLPGIPGLAVASADGPNGVRHASSFANSVAHIPDHPLPMHLQIPPPPQPLPGFPAAPNDIASMNPQQFQAFMVGRGMVPPPPPPPSSQIQSYPYGQLPNGGPIAPPSTSGTHSFPGHGHNPNLSFPPIPPPGSLPIPPGFDPSKIPQGIFPNFMPPATSTSTSTSAPSYNAMNNMPDGVTSAASGGPTDAVRRRGPLPSQQESLMLEQQQGRYRIVR